MFLNRWGWFVRMHRDRSGFTIVLSLVPLALALAFFVSWYNAGMPTITLPNTPWLPFSLPALSAPSIPVPAPLVAAVQFTSGHAGTIFPGLAVGVFIGLIATGSLVDATGWIGRWVRVPAAGADSDDEDAEVHAEWTSASESE